MSWDKDGGKGLFYKLYAVTYDMDSTHALLVLFPSLCIFSSSETPELGLFIPSCLRNIVLQQVRFEALHVQTFVFMTCGMRNVCSLLSLSCPHCLLFCNQISPTRSVSPTRLTWRKAQPVLRSGYLGAGAQQPRPWLTLFYPSPCAQALCNVLPWVAVAPRHIHPLYTGKRSGCTGVAQLHGLLPQVVNVHFHKHPCRFADPFMYYTH